MSRRRVAVLFGGRSPEHWISVKSALFCLLHLDRERWDPTAIYVDHDGQVTDPRATRQAIATFFGRNPQLNLFLPGEDSADPAGRLQALAGDAGRSSGLGGFDVVFPVFHGRFGEDGTVQGWLKVQGLPTAGCCMAASALGMNKTLTKKLAQGAGLAVAPYRELLRSTWEKQAAALEAECLKNLGLPLFVKPARLGSSIGVSRVLNAADLHQALGQAFAWDSRVLVETEMKGHEFSLAVLGQPGNYDLSAIAEYTMEPETFHYDAKYGAQAPEDLIPAPIDTATAERLRTFAAGVASACGVRGIARVDSFLTPDGPVLNEINTMPGLGPGSPFVRTWGAVGVPPAELFNRILDEAAR